MTTTQHQIEAHARYAALVRALHAQLGHRAIVSPGEALSALPGRQAADPESAAYQRIRAGTYPYPVQRVGRKPVVLVTDIAEALLRDIDSGSAMPTHDEPTARGRGRPRLTDAARSAGGAS